MRQTCALAGLALLLAACGRQPRPLVLMIPGSGDPGYWRLAHLGGIKAALDLDVDVALSDGKPRKAAGFVVGPGTQAPADSFSVGLQTFGTATGTRSEVSSDFRAGGEQAARWVADLLAGEGAVAMMVPEKDDPAVRARVEGFMSALKAEYPKMRLVRTERVAANNGAARAAMLRLIQQEPDVRVLYADSEPITLGAVEMLKSRANTKVRMVASAKSEPLIDELRTRVIDGLLVEDAAAAGYAAVAAAVHWRRGTPGPPEILVPMHLVHRINMEKPDVVELLRPDYDGWASRLKLRLR